MFLHHLEDSRQLLEREIRIIQQRFDISTQDRQRRAQFVRNVRDKVAANFIDCLSCGDVVKENRGAGRSRRCRF